MIPYLTTAGALLVLILTVTVDSPEMLPDNNYRLSVVNFQADAKPLRVTGITRVHAGKVVQLLSFNDPWTGLPAVVRYQGLIDVAEFDKLHVSGYANLLSAEVQQPFPDDYPDQSLLLLNDDYFSYDFEVIYDDSVMTLVHEKQNGKTIMLAKRKASSKRSLAWIF
ncbi:hypothetical protein [Spartinivicinus ruber]|uniref:hypothetical protein n=1 Tax=Spartinivicinus ruber TaxID=2683272 RepID=UPI0013D5CCB3|nr:hypothetical protein [Spartinivicinus ruber]